LGTTRLFNGGFTFGIQIVAVSLSVGFTLADIGPYSEYDSQ